MQQVVAQWTTPVRELSICSYTHLTEVSKATISLYTHEYAHSHTRCISIMRFDADTTWSWLRPAGISAPAVYIGAFTPNGTLVWKYGGARDKDALRGSIVLAALQGKPSSPAVEFAIAQTLAALNETRGAVMAVLLSPPGVDPFTFRCDLCHIGSVGMPITMISSTLSSSLLSTAAGSRAPLPTHHVTARDEEGPALAVGVDHKRRLFEMGWWRWPSLSHVAYAMQHQVYLEEVEQNIEKERKDSSRVAVFENTALRGAHGAVSTVHIGSTKMYDRLKIEFRLECPSLKDESCPVYDHLIQVFVCCGDAATQATCPACSLTPWVSGEAGVVCGWEIARYATPYRRRTGHWLTDATHALGFFFNMTSAHQTEHLECRIRAQSSPWQGNWNISMNLWFYPPSTSSFLTTAAKAPLPRGRVIVPLPFTNATYNSGYNRQWPKYTFHVPNPSPPTRNGDMFSLFPTSVVLSSIVSGHGEMNAAMCAEFCQVVYRFSVNGVHTYNLTFPEAYGPSRMGCTTLVLDKERGIIPNHNGNWWFGRNGWCPGNISFFCRYNVLHVYMKMTHPKLPPWMRAGSAIPAWTIDITNAVQYDGENTIEYSASWVDEDKKEREDPDEAWGHTAAIWMSSSLTFNFYSNDNNADSVGYQ